MEVTAEHKIGCKNTKLGWIPEDWKIYRFNEIAKFFSGGTPKTSNRQYYSGEIPFIKSGEIGLFETAQKISKEGLKNSSAKLVSEGDLLLALYGANSGEVSISKLHGAINQAILCIRTKHNVDFLNNLLYYKKNEIIQKYLQGGQGNLSAQIIKKLDLAIPSMMEQKAIANCLNTWDKAIQDVTELLDQKVLQKKGLMQQLLTGKSRLNGFVGDWTTWTYQELFKKVSRPVTWDDEETYDLISVRRRSGGLFHRDSLKGKKILTKKLYTAKTGDFLMSKMQILHGASGIVTREFDDMKISGSYIAVVPINDNILDMEYLNWYSQTPYFYHQTYRSSYGVHIEKMTFNYKLFQKEEIELPGIEEQNAIVKVLNASQKEIELLKQKRDQLKEQKKGLMQQLLTGKKRLKF